MNKSLKITAVLLVLVVFWMFYFVLQFIYGSPANKNLNYIPVESNTVVALNADFTIKSILNDFISSEDKGLLEKITESKNEIKKSTGINILSDIILFKVNENGRETTGLLVNLNSEREFKSNFEGSIISSNSSVGVIIFEENQNNKSQLQKLANSILKKENSLYTNKLASKRKSESVISIWTRTNSSNTWNCANLSMKGSTIKVVGTAVFDRRNHSKPSQIKANKNSFHISLNGIVPEAMSDSIIKSLQIKDNHIIGFSANYRSLKIEQEKSFEIVPDGDFIFQFEKPIDVKSLLNSALENEIIFELNDDSYLFGGKQYFFDQISETSFYLGRSNFENIQIENNLSNLSLHGEPRYLSKIEGSPLMLRLMNIFPAYRMGNGLSKSIKSIDIDLQAKSSEVVKLDGEIEFQKGKYASIELIRSVLELL